MSEIAEYAKLVSIGFPTLIEIKGVTFCGTANASNLTMKNIPFHQEVRQFARALCDYLEGEYDLACEHEHSCCILISHKDLKIGGKWHTWINYEKFHELQAEWQRTGRPFTTMDYLEQTPDWAVYGANEAGFDPNEMRWKRKPKGVKGPDVEEEPDDDKQTDASTSEGCG